MMEPERSFAEMLSFINFPKNHDWRDAGRLRPCPIQPHRLGIWSPGYNPI